MGGDPELLGSLHPGHYDFAFDTPDGLLLVELDEEQHFTRYRAVSLALSEHLALPWSATYTVYCQNDEQRLLPRWGTQKRWSNASSARFFGCPAPPGDMAGNGSPRWRQRAFYDSVKDALPGRRLARLSVYDTVDGRTLEELLRRPDPSAGRAVQELAIIRTQLT